MSTPKKPSGCSSCGEKSCAAAGRRPDESPEEFADRQKLARNLCGIRHKILVMSGKGGVGKSTVAANLAAAMAADGLKVGLLDVDFHGPSIPRLMGVEGQRAGVGPEEMLLPVRGAGGVLVMSMGLLMAGAEQAVIWRGPLKMGVIKQLLRDTAWGELDCLVIDSPPGTGDEPLSVAQLVPDADGAVLVTTPQDLSTGDVRRSVTFCRQVNLTVLGIIENMSGFLCPHCGKETPLFKTGGGRALAEEMKVPFLGSLPMDPRVVETSDEGRPFVLAHPDSRASGAFLTAVSPVLQMVKQGKET
ncbi:MAG TPA: Mrp/NBP35 family ATP-binding protein [Planctomycetota bacterium]|nr:Mrp/NBP35 family ATP-binding protein [Planctomycetota bacterium]